MGNETDRSGTRASRIEAMWAAPAPLISPSMLNCDFARAGDELAALKAAGVRAVHLDVMDGHFVPNLSYGAPVIADWRKVTDLPFDAHLMMSDPGRYLDDFVEAGCDVIIIHIEVAPDPTELIRRIKGAGCKASLTLNPPTPFSAIEPFLGDVDAILVMSVMPGFGGQKFQPQVLDKVRAARAARPDLPISIDGGINAQTIGQAFEAGATQFVTGSAVFRGGGFHNYAEAVAELADHARRGLQRGADPA